ncbi:MAG: ADP-ribosylation factor-like protein, partial [Candidatus Hodarchaeota archaeon]
MLRQIHIFLESELFFVKNYARALGKEELNNVKRIIQKYIDMPMPGKTFQNNLRNFQLFHRASENLYFLFITDLIDSLQYIDEAIIKTINKFRELFPNPQEIKESIQSNIEFNGFLDQIQKDLHSKISIIGPAYAGKTTLYNMLKSGEEKPIMDFAKKSTVEIDGIWFDLWDFQLKDSFSLLWSKFIRGSDLVIFLFNLANYNLKMINYFLNLHKLESNSSKFLMIGNKRDLVEDADIKRIKSELNISDFKEISLNAPDAKTEIYNFLMEVLELRKKLPQNFGELVKEADDLVLERRYVQALAKYKELITISESYQNIMHTKTLEQKIEDLNNKIKEKMDRRKESEKKKEFEVAKPLIFTRKIKVKSLPGVEPTIPLQDQEPIPEELPPASSKPAKKLVTFQKLDKEKEIKPPKVQIPPLKIIKKVSLPKEIPSETKTVKTEETTKPKAKMPMELFGPAEEIKKDMEKPLVIDYTKELQKIIIEKGSSLSLKLCENLIMELGKSLERALTLDDVKLAAEFFVKQEKLT